MLPYWTPPGRDESGESSEEEEQTVSDAREPSANPPRGENPASGRRSEQRNTASDAREQSAGTKWWRDAVVYETYVRSFADGNGDGVGDLPGIRSRLPYLRDLGVDALWLTPFYTSPMVDHGYDVADYRDVDPLFGTLEDFDALLTEAHRLGLRVIIDVVPNHTSSRHPWFQDALAAAAGSSARERYVFRAAAPDDPAPPNNWTSAFGGPAWSRLEGPDGRPGDWYLHLFAPEQPDLNWRNTEVRREFEEILRFWLDRGADGFRVDVAMGLFKAQGLPDTTHPVHHPSQEGFRESPIWGQPEVHDIYRRWRQILDSFRGQRMAVAEAWTAGPEDLARYVRSDELHQAFNFSWLKAPWSAAAFREVIDDSLAATSLVGATTTWVLSSHDAPRHVTRYGGGSLGLRRARAALLTTLALPGSAYLYQGEELGLPEVTDLPEEALQDPIWRRSGYTQRGRDGCRVPIPWSGARPPYGFSLDGTRPWLPMPEDWGELSVAAQDRDPDSTLSFYRRALRIRREHPALGDGTLRWLEAPKDTLVFARDPGLVCVLNCGENPVRLPDHRRVLLASSPLDGDRLSGNGAVWLAM
ncbi:MAG: DUF3459 domain-containing protein [Streptosporangiales bacterium]|nr:DUF3459 domain-containing protein [Streptosporangiales bacterium]